jgi:uncharacterized protein (TIGR02246 family)
MDMKADAATEKAVMKILQNFSNGCADKKVQQVLNLFATDANVVLFGSEEGEKTIGRAELEGQFRRLFSRPTVYSLEWRWHQVSVEDSVVWVVAEGLAHARTLDQHQSSPYRLTMVLVKRGNKWLITHYHGSEPRRAYK